MAVLYSVAGSAVALAGADKLVGNRGYKRLFNSLGWSRSEMEAAAAAEVVGGLLMVPRATRRLGGALVAAVSGAILLAELRDGNDRLAASRALVMMTGLAALLAPGERD